MPHVIVKAWPGKTEEQKRRLAEAITRDVMDILGYGEESVSVGFEEIPSDRWKKEVYGPDIEARSETLYKNPGYRM
jgi:4-oxalocrotonate tautomerase